MRAVHNPPNPWQSHHVEYLEDAPAARLHVHEETARSILSRNDSPDLPFTWSINPYRGCFHACAYCYARPSHQYLGFGAGSDFEREIVVKVNAVELLREAFRSRKWSGEAITFSGNTDCYQPLEASYALTRGLLETCAEHHNPAGIITKSALVRRDVDVLQDLSRHASCTVFVSIPFLNDDTARRIEPGASPPSKRMETLRILSAAGIRTGIAVAPIIPGLNEADLAPLLERAADAGVKQAFMITLRLPAEVRPVFISRVEETLSPERVQHIRSAVRDVRNGRDNDPQWGTRMTGTGPRADALKALFQATCRRLRLNVEDPGEHENRAAAATTFIRPGQQLALFR